MTLSNNSLNYSVNIIDAIMGEGKSTWLMNTINKDYSLSPFNGHRPKKYIILTMYLDEVDRFISGCRIADFKSPEPIHGRKYFGLNRLIKDGENIVTTHALWSLIDRKTFKLLKEQNYCLFVDEVMDCVRTYDDITRHDMGLLLERKFITVDAFNRLNWNHEAAPNYSGKFDALVSLCDNGNLVYENQCFLLWKFPIEFLAQFSEVWIATYLWEGSLMSNYLEANKVGVAVHTLSNRNLIPYGEVNEAAAKSMLRKLITIIDDDKLNAVGSVSKHKGTKMQNKINPLSSSWYKRQNEESLKSIKTNTYNYFNNISKGGSNLAMWTSFKRDKNKLKGKGYTKGWVPYTTKATNEYKHKANLAYLVNVFMMPPIKQYLERNGATINEDMYALSELVQWTFRSRIREGEPINLYIPSERMRAILINWLNPPTVRQALAA